MRNTIPAIATLCVSLLIAGCDRGEVETLKAARDKAQAELDDLKHHARAETLYPSGQVMSRFGLEYRGDGLYRQNGTVEMFHESGQLQSKVEVRDGKPTDQLATSFHSNGKKSEEGWLRGGEQDGAWISWWPDGTKQSESSYRNGKLNGYFQSWYENGQARDSGDYVDAERNGQWFCYARDGKPTWGNGLWNHGKLTEKDK